MFFSCNIFFCICCIQVFYQLYASHCLLLVRVFSNYFKHLYNTLIVKPTTHLNFPSCWKKKNSFLFPDNLQAIKLITLIFMPKHWHTYLYLHLCFLSFSYYKVLIILLSLVFILCFGSYSFPLSLEHKSVSHPLVFWPNYLLPIRIQICSNMISSLQCLIFRPN